MKMIAGRVVVTPIPHTLEIIPFEQKKKLNANNKFNSKRFFLFDVMNRKNEMNAHTQQIVYIFRLVQILTSNIKTNVRVNVRRERSFCHWFRLVRTHTLARNDIRAYWLLLVF